MLHTFGYMHCSVFIKWYFLHLMWHFLHPQRCIQSYDSSMGPSNLGCILGVEASFLKGWVKLRMLFFFFLHWRISEMCSQQMLHRKRISIFKRFIIYSFTLTHTHTSSYLFYNDLVRRYLQSELSLAKREKLLFVPKWFLPKCYFHRCF